MYPDFKTIESELKLMKACGLNAIRLDFLWDQIEPVRGEFDFNFYDRLVNLVRQYDIRILGVLGYSALWANSMGLWNVPPDDPNDFAHFAAKVASRYMNIIDSWEIWNEPNQAMYFDSRNWALDYVNLLKVVYPAIKQVSSGLIVLHGGLAQPNVFDLRKLYESGAGNYFDVVNIHPFENPVDLERRPFTKVIELNLADILEVMSEFGDNHKKICISELGCPGVVARENWHEDVRENWFMGKSPTADQQAMFAADALSHLLSLPYVTGVYWAFWRDTRHFRDDTDYFGLIDWKGNKKPAYDACQKTYASHVPSA